MARGLSYFLKDSSSEEGNTDRGRVGRLYHYWRIRTFYSMFVGYVLYYFTRKSYAFVMPSLIEDLHFTEGQMGLIASAFSIAYAFSKFTSGVLADRSNPRYVMGLGLMMTGVINIAFGAVSSIYFFTILWALNGIFQGFGAPPCARLMVHWYSQSERGRWWAAWNTAHNVGGWATAITVAYCAHRWGWRFGMLVPGILCIIGGFFLIQRLRDTPESLGLPPIEKFRNDHPELANSARSAAKLSLWELLRVYVLRNPYIWILVFSNLFLYVVRTAVNDWSFLYYAREKGYSKVSAGICVSWFEVGGFFGSLVAGWLSDFCFQGRRGPVNALFMLGMLLAVVGMWSIPGQNLILDSICVGAVGFFIFGPQLLIGMAAAELAQKQAAGSATGFAGFFGYVGSAIAGLPCGYVLERYGWDGFFLVLAVCSLMGLLLLLPLWRISSQPKKSGGQASETIECAAS